MGGKSTGIGVIHGYPRTHVASCHQGIFLDTASTVGDSLRRGASGHRPLAANGHRPLATNGPARGTSPRSHAAPVLSPKDHAMEKLDEIRI